MNLLRGRRYTAVRDAEPFSLRTIDLFNWGSRNSQFDPPYMQTHVTD